MEGYKDIFLEGLDAIKVLSQSTNIVSIGRLPKYECVYSHLANCKTYPKAADRHYCGDQLVLGGKNPTLNFP